jgi:hypothetical protein
MKIKFGILLLILLISCSTKYPPIIYPDYRDIRIEEIIIEPEFYNNIMVDYTLKTKLVFGLDTEPIKHINGTIVEIESFAPIFLVDIVGKRDLRYVTHPDLFNLPNKTSIKREYILGIYQRLEDKYELLLRKNNPWITNVFFLKG